MIAGPDYPQTSGALTDSTANHLTKTYAHVPRADDENEGEPPRSSSSSVADPLLEALFEQDKLAGKATSLAHAASNAISRDLRAIERIKGKATDDNFAAIAPRHFEAFEEALLIAKSREQEVVKLVEARELPVKHAIGETIVALQKAKENVGKRVCSSVPAEQQDLVFQLLVTYFDPSKSESRSDIVRDLNPFPHVKVALRDMLLRVQEYHVELDRLDNIRRDATRATEETNGVRRMYLGALKRCAVAFSPKVAELSKEIEVADETFIRWLGEQRLIKTRMHILTSDVVVWKESKKPKQHY